MASREASEELTNIAPYPSPSADDGSGRELPVNANGEASGIEPPIHKGGTNTHVTDLLIELGCATREQVEEAIEAARASSALTPQRVLLDNLIVTPDDIARALAERFGLEHVDLSVFKVNQMAANMVSGTTARRFGAVPIDFIGDNTLLVAMTDPANVLAVDDLAIMTGYEVKAVVASAADVDSVIGQMTELDSTIEDAILTDFEEEREEEQAEISNLRESADDAPTIKLTHAIIAQGLQARASDIHFESGDNEMHVRYRVDGVLAEAATVPRRMVPGLVSRVKVMADLDIAEHRLPQDGRVTMKIEGRQIDIRVVSLPSIHGESVILRLLDKEQSILGLDSLGLQGAALERFQAAVKKPHGAVLVTGPTGSGKTTSLYAGLQMINTPDKSIVTIEDPVEYQVAGVTQMQVHPKAGLKFSTGLRSMLRADPDVIMVGEVRDGETAQIAIEAALTGHLVLTTLHTNDAPAAINRLLDMGIEPFLIASAVDCVVAQRLARRLCGKCKRPFTIDAEMLRAGGFEAADGESFEGFEPVGCSRCNSTGYRGRLGIFEVMSMDEEIRKLAISGGSADAIREQARSEGMRTLREDGLEKVRQGITSIEEVGRVIT